MLPAKQTAVLIVTAILVLACDPGVQAKQPVYDRLLNGDFTAPLDSGWSRDNRDFAGSSEIKLLRDGGVTLRKVQCGWTRLGQRFLLPDRNVTFRTNARLRASVNRSGYYATASVIIEYLDADEQPLGETWFQAVAGRGPSPNTATRHFIPVSTTGGWQELELDIADELRRNLPGVKPAKVAALHVMLKAYGSNTRTC